MTTESKTIKKARGAQEQKLRDKADKLILEAHPETVEIAINKAHGVARNIVCPYCEGKFDVKVGDKCNAELLKALLEQVRGRPKQVSEVDLNAKVDLENSQLLRLWHRLLEFQKGQTIESIESIEAEFKAIEEPKPPEPLQQEASQPISSPLITGITIPSSDTAEDMLVETSTQYAVIDNDNTNAAENNG